MIKFLFEIMPAARRKRDLIRICRHTYNRPAIKSMSNEKNFNLFSVVNLASVDDLGPANSTTRPLVLGLDTATEMRSLAVCRGSEVLAVGARETIGADTSTVLGDMDRVLRTASVSLKQIDLFAVAIGPGSFTGLRVGLATVKALSMTLRKQVIGVPTLHAVAHGALPSESLLAAIPAGRGEVFAQHLGLNKEGKVIEHGPPRHLSPDELIKVAKDLGHSLTWAGNGAVKYRAHIENAARAEGISLTEGAAIQIREGERVWKFSARSDILAKNIAALAAEKIGAGQPSTVEQLKAVYVRPADAKLKRV
jgi:tRNA threonylcarbamoyladenosine biosynthesis protein TsaB